MELANDPIKGHDSLNRAVHVLSCLGSGAAHSPFKCQPSSLQVLRAHQGFKEKVRAVQSTWLHGVIDDSSVALISSAALFEELTSGCNAGLEVLDQAFSMVLPGYFPILLVFYTIYFLSILIILNHFLGICCPLPPPVHSKEEDCLICTSGSFHCPSVFHCVLL